MQTKLFFKKTPPICVHPLDLYTWYLKRIQDENFLFNTTASEILKWD